MGKEFEIERLRGSENYHTWCFAAQNVMLYRQLQKCITDPVTEKDADKLNNCKAWLALSVDPSLYVHIKSCDTALKIWKALKNLFEDNGLSRKIGLLRNLISGRLEDSDSMQSYVDGIVDNANKLDGIGFTITDEWKTAILLAGLTVEYKPFIMGIEASNSTLTSDAIISKLLDSQASDAKGDAFFSNKKKFAKRANTEKKKCPTCKKRHAGVCNLKIAENAGTAKNAFGAFISRSENDWYVDSGASSHMTPNATILANKQKCEIGGIKAANGETMKVKGIGNAKLNIDGKQIDVNNILHVPNLSVNLLSVGKIVESGNTVTFDKKNGCTILNTRNEIVANCKNDNGIFKFSENDMKCLMAGKSESALLWHRRLGHVNLQCLKKMRDGGVIGMKFDDDGAEIKNCETCAQAKQTRNPFHASETHSQKILELIHSDLCGPMETQSIGHARYILTFIDDFSKKVFVYFLKSKAEAMNKFIEFKNYVEVQTENKIRILRTDNGGEYCSVEFERYCKNQDIRHQLTTAYTPEQNGVAERMNRTLIERAKCLLFDADLPKSYWAEAINMAAYLINRTICSSHGKVPNELFFNERVNISDLRIFGSPVMVHVPKQKRKKWDKKSVKMLFVGYDRDVKGFRCIEGATRKLIVSRDVVFYETAPKSVNNMDIVETVEKDTTPHEANSQKDESTINNTSNSEIMAPINNVNNNQQNDAMNHELDTSDEFDTPNATATNETLNVSDYVPDEPINMEELQQTTRTLRSAKPITPPFQLNHFALFIEPTTVKEAIKCENAAEWRKAMDEEIESHKSNKTWSIVPLPHGRKPIKAKWVFKAKRNDAGEVVRHKARLVA